MNMQDKCRAIDLLCQANELLAGDNCEVVNNVIDDLREGITEFDILYHTNEFTKYLEKFKLVYTHAGVTQRKDMLLALLCEHDQPELVKLVTTWLKNK